MASGNPNNLDRDYSPADRGWGYGCGWWWFIWFWLLVIIILGGWGWWGGWWGRGWNNRWQGSQPQAHQNGPQNPQITSEPMRPIIPTELQGRSLTLHGQIDRVYGANSFTLKAGESGASDLLVVTSKTATPKQAFKQGDHVTVTGKMEKFDRNTLQTETGSDLANLPANDFTGKSTLLASAVNEQPSSNGKPGS